MTFAKAIAAAVAVAVTGVVSALTDGSLDLAEIVVVALSVLGSAGVVWYSQNGPEARYVKAVVAALSAGLASLLVALNDNVVTHEEWSIALTAAVGASGLVALVRNSTN